MKAMILSKVKPLAQNPKPLVMTDLPVPVPKNDEVLIKVAACGVCHTELDEIEGRTSPAFLPIVLGHQVVGTVVQRGANAERFPIEARVGVAWIFSACGRCNYCKAGLENLCAEFKATGRDVNGGYAEYMTAPESFIYPLPTDLDFVTAAPLLCAGAIGYRSLMLANLKPGQYLGLSGFGASAHLVLKLVRFRYPDVKIYVFARNQYERDFALSLGATWAGDFDDESPEKLHAIIDTTPVWKPIVATLKNLVPAGRMVINSIRKESHDQHVLQELDYARDLWLEKEIKSVANVTRADVQYFLQLAAQIPIIPTVEIYPLNEANRALTELKNRQIRGAKVLVIE